MKKIACLILVLGVLVIVFSSAVKGEKDKERFTVDNNSVDNITVQEIYQLPTDKIKNQYSIEDFKGFYAEYLKLNDVGNTLENYTISDITPENIKDEIGCQIFKDNSTYETYVIYKGELFRIGFGFGGMGVVMVTTCDFKEDGQKDLIYTFSFGSGLHRSHIGVFDLSEKQETWLDYRQTNEDIVLQKLSDYSFEVYTSILEFKEDHQYEITPVRKVAKVQAKNGNIVVTPVSD